MELALLLGYLLYVDECPFLGFVENWNKQTDFLITWSRMLFIDVFLQIPQPDQKRKETHKFNVLFDHFVSFINKFTFSVTLLTNRYCCSILRHERRRCKNKIIMNCQCDRSLIGERERAGFWWRFKLHSTYTLHHHHPFSCSLQFFCPLHVHLSVPALFYFDIAMKNVHNTVFLYFI